MLDIRELEIDVALIVAYASDEDAIMIRVSERGEVSWLSNYCAIGSGDNIATAILCQEDYDEGMPLMDCLTRLYSAKLASEKDPYVGSNTYFGVLTKDGRAFDLSDEGIKIVKQRSRRIRFPSKIPFKDNYLEELTE